MKKHETSLRHLAEGKGLNKVACPLFLGTLFLLVILSLQIVSFAEPSPPYPIKDSGMPAFPESVVTWLDNDHLIFGGFKVGPGSRIKPDGQWNMIEQGYYVWNLNEQKVIRYASRDGVGNFCIHNSVLTYLRSGEIITVQLSEGRLSGEQTKLLPHPYWFNPFSCRYYDTPPAWVVEGHATQPLLEEHGHLDWGSTLAHDEVKNTPMIFYPPSTKEGIQLPIGRREVWRYQIRHAGFRNAYFLFAVSYVDKTTGHEDPVGVWPKGRPLPVWWLTPDGKVTKIDLPYTPLLNGGSRGFYPTRTGVFAFFHGFGGKRPPGDIGPGDAGGYLVQGEKMTKLISGHVRSVVVSPNGCKVVFVHDPSDTEFGKDRFDRITVKMIDVCQGGTHG